jgi:GAF domain-containing protein
MLDDFARDIAAQGQRQEIKTILAEVCRLTDMGFAAVARVTDTRWIACQVLDKIEFGLEPGSELELKTTICAEIRESGVAVVIDQVSADRDWQRHPVPALYGFESYVSVPIVLPDGSFWGTLCAIDPNPRALSNVELVAQIERFAKQVADLLSDAGATSDVPA